MILTGSMGYTGATTIGGGTLQIGDGGTAGALPASSVITTNGTLAFNRSDTVTQGTDFDGTGISGTGGVTQAGVGNLILNTANTHSGITKATAGTLTATHSLALQNSTVDTTGAGDVFHGAFCYSVLEGATLRDALEFSNAMAALNCTQLGARGGLATRIEALDLIQRGERRSHPDFAPNS